MNKGLAITGGVLLLLALFGFVFSVAGIATYEPNSDNILHDTETDGTVFNFDGTSSWLEVYAKGDVDCYSYSISVTDDMFEYFYPNCDAGTEITGYTYLGDVEIYDAGTYNIDAEGDVVIVDADDLFGPVFAMCGGGVCCLVGLILLIVGLSTGKSAPQMIVYQQPDGTMYQPNQTTVHQYIPHLVCNQLSNNSLRSHKSSSHRSSKHKSSSRKTFLLLLRKAPMTSRFIKPILMDFHSNTKKTIEAS